jgi:hypothetical protein
MFIIGQTYRRRDDIHGKFGGQQQGEFPRRDSTGSLHGLP